MKRALITGVSGFVGRNMAAELARRGWSVLGVDVRGDVDSLWPGVDFRQADVLEYIFPWEDSERFDLTIHCAFHVGGRAQIDSNKANLAKNLELDAAMFSWAVRTEQPRVLYFSSSAVYPTYLQGRLHPHMPMRMSFPSPVKNPNDYRLQEGDADLLDDPALLTGGAPDADYGFAKLAGERMAANARAMGVKVHTVRTFSGYGEDQSLDYPFPSIVKRAREGNLTVWGPREQARDWIYISDVIAGALAVVDADCELPVNLCTGRAVTMGELALMVWKQEYERLGHHLTNPFEKVFGPESVEYQTDKPTGVLHRVGDPSFMETFYKPRVSLEEGVRRALARGPQ